MSTETTDAPGRVASSAPSGRLSEFEAIYRANVGALAAYFARRCTEPQEVADLTSETVLQAAGSFAGFDPRRGSPRAWLFGIAAHVFARHCAAANGRREALARLAGHRPLGPDELEELTNRIDAEATGRQLLARCARLSEAERQAIELVELMDLTPKEAAAVLGVSRGVLRTRLLRARTHLRKELNDEPV